MKAQYNNGARFVFVRVIACLSLNKQTDPLSSPLNLHG